MRCPNRSERRACVRSLTNALAGALVHVCVCSAHAQTCGWAASGLPIGNEGRVSALHVWDPDGPGAQQPRLIVGGYNLRVPGTSQPTSMLQYTPATNTWSALSAAPTDQVIDIAEAPNRSLIVGGKFQTIGGLSARNIARLSPNGTWSALGSGLAYPDGSGWVYSVDVYPNGDIAAGGQFATATIGGAVCISRWNGSSWASWGSSSTVFEVAVTPQNTLLVANEGSFGGFPGYFGSFDGTTWTLFGDSGCAYIHVIERVSTGEYLLGGTLFNPRNSGARSIARMSADGQTFSPLGAGFRRLAGIGRVAAILPRSNGEIIAGGDFEASGSTALNGVARWNGSAWLPLGIGVSYPNYIPSVEALAALPDGRIAVGGFFGIAGGVESPGLAFWTPTDPAVFTMQPVGRTVVCPGMAANYAVQVNGTVPIAVQWQSSHTTFGPWLTLTETPQPFACAGGPGNSGASASSPTAAATSVLLRPCTNTTLKTTMYVRCVATNACGSTISNTVSVVYCPADFNCSGGLSVGDVFEFIAAWFAGDLRADANGSGTITVQDVFDFLTGWFNLCV